LRNSVSRRHYVGIFARQVRHLPQRISEAGDKIPPVDKIYDFTFVHAINAELDAARWKPTA